MLDQVVPIQTASWTPASARRAISVGGVSLALSGASFDDVRLGSDLSAFESEASQSDIEVSVDWAANLQKCAGKPHFDSGAVWTLFSNNDDEELIFDFTSPALGPRPYKRMYADQSFRNVRIVLNRDLLHPHCVILPLEYPADELLITNYLASGLGVEVHGCGLVDPETGGHLFLGHSGAGKSTTTKLWQTLRNPQILSDDRIILRLHNGELWMYGTPWHGEAAFAMPGKARLNRIFILEHGAANEFTPLSRSRAVGEMFARCFPPFHSAVALARTVSFLDRILDAVPCYQFQFVPNAGAVDAVVGFHE
jgi:hypothetical protein